MAAVGKSNISYKKLNVANQRSAAFGFQKIVFAHQASAGATGISLTALTLPTLMQAEGFNQPSATELSRAGILNNRRNLTLISSSKGVLVDYLSYEVTSNNQLDFIGFTAEQDEIFIGIIDNSIFNGASVEEFTDRLGATERYRILTASTNVDSPLDMIAADTSANAFTVTLPSNPTVGDAVIILDAQSTFGTNNLTIARNGKLIRGAASNFVAVKSESKIVMTYVSDAYGWALIEIAGTDQGLVTSNNSVGNMTMASGTCRTVPFLNIQSGHTYTVNSGAQLVVPGDLTINGTLVDNGSVVVL